PRLRARIVALGVTSLFAFYAFTTALRALEWSDPLTLSATNATKRPDSSSAQYDYARILLASTLKGDPEPMRKRAFEILDRMAANPSADAVHNQLLIVTSAKLGLPIKDQWWDSLIAKLQARPISTVDVSALGALLNCLDAKICPRDIEHFKEAFDAATSHPGGYAQLLTLHARFALVYLGDLELAERQFRSAIFLSPTDAEARANLVTFLIRTGDLKAAALELQTLRNMNGLGNLDGRLLELEIQLRKATGIDDESHKLLFN
ncbi:tetratricopeptide repeat protein, partial [Dokdonella immobilis]